MRRGIPTVTLLGARKAICASYPRVSSSLSPGPLLGHTYADQRTCYDDARYSMQHGIPRVYIGWYIAQGVLFLHTQGGIYPGIPLPHPGYTTIPGYIPLPHPWVYTIMGYMHPYHTLGIHPWAICTPTTPWVYTPLRIVLSSLPGLRGICSFW